MAGVSLDAAVSEYLPADWVPGTGFSDNGVTFRQLLTHESGLKQMFDAMSESDKPEWTNEWDGLQFIVSNGAMPGASYAYKNANYALMRVLVPRLEVLSGAGPVTPITQANHAAIFLTFVSQNVLEPARIFITSCTASSQFDEAYYFSFDFIEEGGNLAEYSLPTCGGTGGFRLSAMEISSPMLNVRRWMTGASVGSPWRDLSKGDACLRHEVASVGRGQSAGQLIESRWREL